MNDINKHPNNIILIFSCMILGLVTGLIILAFLSGKIITIPKGTRQGIIIAGVGVLVIMIIMSAVGVGVNLLII